MSLSDLGALIPVQTSNVTKLYKELGYASDFPARERKFKELKSLVDQYNVDSLGQGNPLPLSKANSAEAYHLAERFYTEQNYALNFWRKQDVDGLPPWPRGKDKVLRIIAHIFSLKAFHKYQDKCKKQRQKATKVPEPQAESVQRELSPESRKYVRPPPPKGTLRRPAKKADGTTSPGTASVYVPPISLDTALLTNETQRINQYIQNIESLNPENDNGNLKGFPANWLGTLNAKWPEAVDHRLQLFMHEHHCYSLDAEEVKHIELIRRLRQENDIEEKSVQDYILLRDRALARIEHLSNLLRLKKILEIRNGKYEMNEEFKKVWRNRKSYWEQMPKEKIPEIPSEPSMKSLVDLPEDDERPRFKRFSMSPSPKISNQQRDKDLYDASEDEGPLPKKAPPVTPRKSDKNSLPSEIRKERSTKNKAQNSIMSFLSKTSVESPVIDLEEYESPSIKRQKMTLPNGSFTGRPVTENPAETTRQLENTRKRRLLSENAVADELMSRVSSVSLALRASVEMPAQISPSITEDDAREDSVTAEHVRFGNELLRSPTMSVRPSPPLRTNLPSQIATDRRLSSPQPIPDPSEQFLNQPTTRQDPSQPMTPTSPYTLDHEDQKPSFLPTPQITPFSKNALLELLLVIQKADLSYGFKSLPQMRSASDICDSSLHDFFVSYAQVSGVALEKLTCLTFTFLFTANVEVVWKDDEESWELLKKAVRTLSILGRKRGVSQSEFHIVIDIGDKRRKNEEEVL